MTGPDPRERGWTRHPSAVRPEDPIRPEDIATIPAVYRRTIARWIAERGARVAGPRSATWVGEQYQTGYLAAIAGFATDLTDPLSEDSSISHQLHTLAQLVTRDEVDALAFRRDFPTQRPASPVGHVLYPPGNARRNVHCSNCGDTRGGPVGHEAYECTYRPPAAAAEVFDGPVPVHLERASVVEQPPHPGVAAEWPITCPACRHESFGPNSCSRCGLGLWAAIKAAGVVDATTLDDAAAGRRALLCETCGRPVDQFPCGPTHATAARLYAARPHRDPE